MFYLCLKLFLIVLDDFMAEGVLSKLLLSDPQYNGIKATTTTSTMANTNNHACLLWSANVGFDKSRLSSTQAVDVLKSRCRVNTVFNH